MATSVLEAPVDFAERLRAGDREAFAAAAREQQARLVRLVGRFVATREDAEDVVQDALVDAYRSICCFRGEASFGTWLARIAIRKALRASRRAAPPELATGTRPGSGPVDHATALAVRAAVHRLPAEQRAVVVLRFWEGLSGHEIAELLGRRQSTIWTQLYRALERLRGELKEEET